MTTAALHRSDETGSQAGQLNTETEQPLRLLLLRDRDGELPWVVQTITRIMAPVELVEVRNLANALWRLGQERFDTVLLDLTTVDRMASDVCRQHIIEVGALPVLDLNADDQPQVAPPPVRQAAAAPAPRARAEPVEPRRIMWPPRVGKHRGNGRDSYDAPRDPARRRAVS